MPTSDFFAATYAEARARFRSAAHAAHARLKSYALSGLRGPDNEELTLDLAMLGPAEPRAALVLISGTHGVEGFCGSGCQVGYLDDRLYEALPPGTASVLVHALNPYGFAWLRRVTEDNIDLNRNFHDFAQPLPSSADYEAIHDWLVPADWDGPSRQAADRALQQYVASRGQRAFQAAATSGQYTRPNGLFYGGTKPGWSNAMLSHILTTDVPKTVTRIASLDFHSGLGPRAYGEPIYGGSAEGFERARQWYGPEVTNVGEGTSTSAPVTGSIAAALEDLVPSAQITHVTLEYGTKPQWEMLNALRADHWLHAIPDRDTPLRAVIKRQIRDAFYPDEPAWKAAVYGRASDFILRASRGLAGS
jgi:hypothetical protein